MARSLGRSLHELRETVTAQEFGLWWAAYLREPWGDYRVDMAGAVVARTLGEINRDREKAPTPFQYRDFMPFAQVEEEEAEVEPEAPPATAATMFQQLSKGFRT